MNQEVAFCIGTAWPLAVGGVSYLIGHKIRHRCKKDNCGCLKTTTHYRLLHLHKAPKTKYGLSIYAVYKFRVCRNGHATVSMKTKQFSDEQIRAKSQSEFDWSSDFIKELCSKASIDNPYVDYHYTQFNEQNPIPKIPVIDPKAGARITSSAKMPVRLGPPQWSKR